MDKAMEGGCACGELRYALREDPLIVHCCHCTSCQTETGSAFAINALIEADRVEVLDGQAEPIFTPSESGNGQQIWRCPTCKVAVWSNYSQAGDKLLFVRVGTLDQPSNVVPDIHIYTRSKLPWVQLPAGALVNEAIYEVAEVWPEPSLKRLDALRGRSDG